MAADYRKAARDLNPYVRRGHKFNFYICISLAFTILLHGFSSPPRNASSFGRPDVPLLTSPSNENVAVRQISDPEVVGDEYTNVPPWFEVNVGQSDMQVKFLSRMRGYAAYILNDGVVLSLWGSKSTAKPESKTGALGQGVPGPKVINSSVRIRLKGANRSTDIDGEEGLPSKSNYFLGSNPGKWYRDVNHYSKVRHRDVYQGIDLVYHGSQSQLEYDFIVAPHANPGVIRLNYEGARGVEIDSQGDLVVNTRTGVVRQHKPIVYQEEGGRTTLVEASYIRVGKNEVGFSLANYDRNRSLTIDPVISYSTYLGGRLVDEAYGVAVDNSGNAYITGETLSADFPVTAGSLQTPPSAGNDVFVAKLNSNGGGLAYATYLGGRKDDVGYGIGVDQSGSAYVTGSTLSKNGAPNTTFPVLPAGAACRGSVFITRLNSSGNALRYSTCFNGQGARGVAVEEPGIAYLTGGADASFPGGSAGPPLPASTKTFRPEGGGEDNGFFDAFVLKINTDASGDASLLYATLLGGNGPEQGLAVATDKAGGVSVTGYTESTNFPVSPNAFQASLSGRRSVFITKLDTNVSGDVSLVYSTYLGRENSGLGIAVDQARNMYVTGRTGGDFPITQGSFQPQPGDNEDAFLSKINPTASSGATSLRYSTYLGGQGFDAGHGIAVDNSGVVTLTGVTQSGDFPVTNNAFQTAHGGRAFRPNFPRPFKGDAFLMRINTTASGAGSLVYSTFFGGSDDDAGNSLALDSGGNPVLAGTTFSKDFPATPGALRTTPLQPSGDRDAFVTKFLFSPLPPANLSVNVAATPSQVSPGGQIRYTITIENGGPNQAADIVLRNLVPVNTTFQQISAQANWQCLTPTAGERGSIICRTPSLAAGSPVSLTVTVSVNCAARSATINNTVSAYAASGDPNEGNNVASVSTAADAGTAALMCPTFIRQNADTVVNGQSGKVVTYTTSTGTCQGVRTTCFPASGSFFPVGTTRVVCSASDASGTVGTCIFNVQIDP
jgi:uncharacterized repeat protein (TIGR01451 family)